jgi:hypothetical protein
MEAGPLGRTAGFQRIVMEGTVFMENFSSLSLLHIPQKKRAERASNVRTSLARPMVVIN